MEEHNAVDAQVAVTKRAPIKGTVVPSVADAMQRPAAACAVDEYALLTGLPKATSGRLLRASLGLFESSAVGASAFRLYAGWQKGLVEIRNILSEGYPEEPRCTPIQEAVGSCPKLVQEEVCDAEDAHARLDAALHSVHRGGHMAGCTKCSTASNTRPTILDYYYAFTHNMVTPTMAAERVIAFLEQRNPTNNWLSDWSAEHIREAAAASTARYAAGKPLSVLDGVPFVVKDCIDALPYETSYGSRFMGKLHPAKADAPCVAALKELGAVLLGKGAMVEFGIFSHGHNPHFGAMLNPHHPSRTAGGSSSGAAAAVATGICPIAIGTDGGGSIRVPASYCGVVGMKPTAGRLADDHCAHNGAYSSLIATGPIANSVADLTLLYAVMANVTYPAADARKPGAASLSLPGVPEAAAAAAATPPRPLGLPHVLLEVPEDAESSKDQVALADLKPLDGLRVGVFPKWCYDCAPYVSDAMKATLDRLVLLGAKQVEINLPEVDLAQLGHIITWLKEMEAGADAHGWLKDWSLRGQCNLDTRMFLVVAALYNGEDYSQAQRMRARAMSHFQRAFESCDVIMTPATPTIAPAVPPEATTTGVYNPAGTLEQVRFTLPANLTGLPALVLPVGRQMGSTLPIGVQFMAPHFAEATLLRTAAALEQQQFEDGMPKPVCNVMVNPIQGEKGLHPLALEMTKKVWSNKYGHSTATTL